MSLILGIAMWLWVDGRKRLVAKQSMQSLAEIF